MIVGSEFPGDENRTLIDVQHSVYGEMVVRLFMGPRDRYLSAAAVLRVDDKLAQKVRSMDGFDHRTLQLAHDGIAAHFRFAHDDGGQLQLGESEVDYRQRLAASWREFVQSEVERLTTENGFIRAICTATAFGNKEPGVADEHWLGQFLKDRYGEHGLGFKNWITDSIPTCDPVKMVSYLGIATGVARAESSPAGSEPSSSISNRSCA